MLLDSLQQTNDMVRDLNWKISSLWCRWSYFSNFWINFWDIVFSEHSLQLKVNFQFGINFFEQALRWYLFLVFNILLIANNRFSNNVSGKYLKKVLWIASWPIALFSFSDDIADFSSHISKLLLYSTLWFKKDATWTSIFSFQYLELL